MFVISQLTWTMLNSRAGSYMISGSAIVTAVDSEGRNFIEQVDEGDVCLLISYLIADIYDRISSGISLLVVCFLFCIT